MGTIFLITIIHATKDSLLNNLDINKNGLLDGVKLGCPICFQDQYSDLPTNK